jgi:hypothetical protein
LKESKLLTPRDVAKNIITEWQMRDSGYDGLVSLITAALAGPRVSSQNAHQEAARLVKEWRCMGTDELTSIIASAL